MAGLFNRADEVEKQKDSLGSTSEVDFMTSIGATEIPSEEDDNKSSVPEFDVFSTPSNVVEDEVHLPEEFGEDDEDDEFTPIGFAKKETEEITITEPVKDTVTKVVTEALKERPVVGSTTLTLDIDTSILTLSGSDKVEECVIEIKANAEEITERMGHALETYGISTIPCNLVGVHRNVTEVENYRVMRIGKTRVLSGLLEYGNKEKFDRLVMSINSALSQGYVFTCTLSDTIEAYGRTYSYITLNMYELAVLAKKYENYGVVVEVITDEHKTPIVYMLKIGQE